MSRRFRLLLLSETTFCLATCAACFLIGMGGMIAKFGGY